jgi:hypothetical protein
MVNGQTLLRERPKADVTSTLGSTLTSTLTGAMG